MRKQKGKLMVCTYFSLPEILNHEVFLKDLLPDQPKIIDFYNALRKN